MKAILALSPLLLFIGCALPMTQEQRTELVDVIATKVSKEISATVEETVLPAVKKKVDEVVVTAVDKLDLTKEKADELKAAAKDAIHAKLEEVFDDDVKAKVKKTVKEAADKVVPKANEDAGGVGKTLAAILLPFLYGLLGMGKKT